MNTCWNSREDFRLLLKRTLLRTGLHTTTKRAFKLSWRNAAALAQQEGGCGNRHRSREHGDRRWFVCRQTLSRCAGQPTAIKIFAPVVVLQRPRAREHRREAATREHESRVRKNQDDAREQGHAGVAQKPGTLICSLCRGRTHC